jgi:hypothetical protein
MNADTKGRGTPSLVLFFAVRDFCIDRPCDDLVGEDSNSAELVDQW